MTQLLKYIESHFTGEVRPNPEMVSFKTEDEELRYPSRIYIHRALLRISLQYRYPEASPPKEMPRFIVDKFAREIYGELEHDLRELQYQLHGLRVMGAPVESALERVGHLLDKIQGKD